MRRKILMGVFALALPIGTVAVLQGTAIAGKVTGTGNPTCNFGGTLTFNPPLTQNGTAGVKKEVTTVNANLTGCTGGTPAAPASVVAVKPIKTKTPKGQNGATCAGFAGNASSVTVKVKINWSGEKPSKFNIAGLTPGVNGFGEVGFSGSFSVAGSYAGAGSLGVYLTPASSNAIATCSAPVSTLNIDPAHSSGTL
jgi:hypothetical protein